MRPPWYCGPARTNPDQENQDDPRETEANAWAADFLIPSAAWAEFCRAGRGVFTESRLIDFAKRQGIAPGIVAGRAQRELGVYSRFNDLFRKLDLVSSFAGSN